MYQKSKTIEDIARHLLNSDNCIGWAISMQAVREACEKYNVEFRVLFDEIVRQGEQEEWQNSLGRQE